MNAHLEFGVWRSDYGYTLMDNFPSPISLDCRRKAGVTAHRQTACIIIELPVVRYVTLHIYRCVYHEYTDVFGTYWYILPGSVSFVYLFIYSEARWPVGRTVLFL